jgi:hypothetical protein
MAAINQNGHRMLWVNCFCDNDRGNTNTTWWKTKPYTPDDTGDCYFNVMIDLTKKKYSRLLINPGE